MGKEKYLRIDLLILHRDGDFKKWNEFLRKCYQYDNVEALKKTLVGIQMGMDHLAKQKMNTPDICHWYARLHRSLEVTARKIFKKKYPMPGDNVMDKEFRLQPKWIEAKKKRDEAFGAFLRKESW